MDPLEQPPLAIDPNAAAAQKKPQSSLDPGPDLGEGIDLIGDLVSLAGQAFAKTGSAAVDAAEIGGAAVSGAAEVAGAVVSGAGQVAGAVVEGAGEVVGALFSGIGDVLG